MAKFEAKYTGFRTTLFIGLTLAAIGLVPHGMAAAEGAMTETDPTVEVTRFSSLRSSLPDWATGMIDASKPLLVVGVILIVVAGLFWGSSSKAQRRKHAT